MNKKNHTEVILQCFSSFGMSGQHKLDKLKISLSQVVFELLREVCGEAATHSAAERYVRLTWGTLVLPFRCKIL